MARPNGRINPLSNPAITKMDEGVCFNKIKTMVQVTMKILITHFSFSSKRL